ncbi:MAG TPA: TetR/AcrR family transcriptional regulator [Solirubrobacterales bacterium]|nr:TetR/AcrR family transcriptional regulator [Solirubrobacterales bacterium]
MTSVLRPTVPADVGARSQRQRIIEALIDSCAEKTYAATTIADIVSRARISRTTFYKRFEDKRACFDAAVAYSLAELREVALAAHAPEDPPADAVREAAKAVLEAMARRPGLAQLLTGDAVCVDPAVFDRYRRLVIPAIRGLWAAAGEEPEAQLDPRLAFGQAQLLIFNEIAAGRSECLPDLLPQIVYLAVAPFGGHEEAMRQSRQAAGSPAAVGSRA